LSVIWWWHDGPDGYGSATGEVGGDSSRENGSARDKQRFKIDYIAVKEVN